MKLIHLLAAALILAACGPAAGGNTAANTAAANTVTPAAANGAKPSSLAAADPQAECRARGGDYRPICLSRTMECVVTFADAGHACSDGSDCQGGICAFEGARPLFNNGVRGRCVATSNPCGCRVRVERGRVTEAMCVD